VLSTYLNILVSCLQVPPPYDGGVVPAMEWWDEAFLHKAVREERRKSKARAQQDDFSLLSTAYCKTMK
jgi:hypothetical protein